MAYQPFLLTEHEDMSLIFSPLKKTQRIKYTCFNVSQKFLVLGATSGGLYVFRREPLSFLQLLPNKEGPVKSISISPNENLFAFSTVKGTVCVLERNTGPGAHIIQISREHVDLEVTALQWNSHSNELYIGDNLGRVSVINILMFMATNMFNMPTFMLMHLDSQIVQLDWQGSLLLISTLTRCYLCNTYKEEYRQIGQKLREGEFGACFCNFGDETVPCGVAKKEKIGSFHSLGQNEALSNYESYRDVKIFCARPGSRLWEVQIDGLVVQNTHQFKEALAVEPMSIINLNSVDLSSQRNMCHEPSSLKPEEQGMYSQQSFNFVQLNVLSKKFLFTFKTNGIYVFDPIKATVVLWNNEFCDIIDCHIYNDTIYLRLVTGVMHAITFSPLEKVLFSLHSHKNYVLCAQLCAKYLDYLMRQVGLSHRLLALTDLSKHIADSDVLTQILPLLTELSKYKEKQKSLQLKSGIYLVHNSHLPLYLESMYAKTIRKMHSNNDKQINFKRSNSLHCNLNKQTGVTSAVRKCQSCSSIPDSLSESPITSLTLKNKLGFAAEQLKPFEREVTDTGNLSLPFTVLANPDAIKTLKHIGSSVTSKITNSTKSLKEKWLTLEDRMKHIGQEYPTEPYDIRPEKTLVCKANSTNESTLMKLDTSQLLADETNEPSVNSNEEVVNINEICSCLESLHANEEDISELTFKLFYNLDMMHDKLLLPHQNSTKRKLVSFEIVTKQLPLRDYFADSTMNVLQETLHKSLKTNLIIEWIEKFSGDIDISSLRIPAYLHSVHAMNDLKNDYILGNILKAMIELVDPNTIINCLKASNVPCYYFSLSAILDRYEEGAFNYLRTSLSNSEKWPFLSLLNAMFWLLRMGQVETCMKMGESVHLKDVLYLVLRLESHLIESGIESSLAHSECYTQFLTYINDVNCSLVDILDDAELKGYILVAFQQLNLDCGKICLCGFPLLPYPPILPRFSRIAELISNHLSSNNCDELIQVATKVPGMWYYMLKHRCKEDTIQVLPLILHTSNASELSHRMIPASLEVWEECLVLFIKYQSGICLNCGHHEDGSIIARIPWTLFALMAVKSLGAVAAVNLFSKHSMKIPPGKIKKQFYHACILSSLVDNFATGRHYAVVDLISNPSEHQQQQKLPTPNLGIKLLEAIRKDLTYSQSSSSIEPDLNFQKLKASKDSSPSGTENKHTRHTPAVEGASRPQTRAAPLTESHWGLAVDLLKDNCPCCTLSLVTPGLICDGGITAFQCGHVYHTVCVKQGQQVECLLCRRRCVGMLYAA